MNTFNSGPAEPLRSQDTISPLALQRQRLLQHAAAVIDRDVSTVGPADVARLSQTLLAALELLKVADDQLTEERRMNATTQAAQDQRLAHLDAMFALAPTPLVLTTGETIIRQANVACASLLGVEAETLAGLQLSDMIPRAELSAFRRQLALAIERGGVDAWSFTLQLRRSMPALICATMQVIDDAALGTRALYWHLRPSQEPATG
jgi:PAS domain-containing protein